VQLRSVQIILQEVIKSQASTVALSLPVPHCLTTHYIKITRNLTALVLSDLYKLNLTRYQASIKLENGFEFKSKGANQLKGHNTQIVLVR
jgi:hypothetical protein